MVFGWFCEVGDEVGSGCVEVVVGVMLVWFCVVYLGFFVFVLLGEGI